MPMMVPATGVSTDKGATHDAEYKDCLAHGHTTPGLGDLIQAVIRRPGLGLDGPLALKRQARLLVAVSAIAPILQDRQPSREL
jgi:hypothetical protein